MYNEKVYHLRSENYHPPQEADRLPQKRKRTKPSGGSVIKGEQLAPADVVHYHPPEHKKRPQRKQSRTVSAVIPSAKGASMVPHEVDGPATFAKEFSQPQLLTRIILEKGTGSSELDMTSCSSELRLRLRAQDWCFYVNGLHELVRSTGTPTPRMAEICELSPSPRCSAAPEQPDDALSPAPVPMLENVVNESFKGGRGQVCMRSAILQSDVLNWLRSDTQICEHATRYQQTGRKGEIFGHTFGHHDLRRATKLNGEICNRPMPERVRVWIAAWKKVNNSNIVALDSVIKEQLAGLTPTQLGDNGLDLQSDSAFNWIGRLGSVQVLPRGYSGGQACYPGGYALFQIGLTLDGTRQLTLFGPDESFRVIPMKTGDVYIGNLVPAQHRFSYPDTSEQLRLVIILQSMIFRRSASAAGNRAPTPIVVWKAAHDVVNKAILDLSWELPSLQHCLEMTAH